MPKLNFKPPKLCRSKARNTAYVSYKGRKIYFGKWGTEESREKYKKFVASWAAEKKSEDILDQSDEGTSLAELFVKFLNDFDSFPNQSKSDRNTYRMLAARLIDIFPDKMADDFGPIDLERVRDNFQQEGFFRAGTHRAYSRQYLNKLVNRIRSIFSWGVSKTLVKAQTYQTLTFVRPLRIGRTLAPESKRKRIVSDAEIDAVCKLMTPTYAEIIRLLRITGMRPSELCGMRIGDIDRSGDIWIYRPSHHKTQSRGKERFIALGHHAQSLILRHIECRSGSEYLFNPKRAAQERWDIRRENARLKPSHQRRDFGREKTRTDLYSDKFNPHGLGLYLKRVCDRAINVGIIAEPFTLYELRHTAITETKLRDGAEAAQHFAGHANIRTQDVYDHSALTMAVELAKKHG